MVNEGLKNFYNSWSDYLPGYLYFLWLLGKINFLHFIPEVLLYKLPAILSDTATGFLIYKILSRIKNKKWGIVGASLFLFNPAVIANSALWGQVDSLTALTSLFSVYIFPLSYILSAISLSVGTLIKPQAAFIFPVIIFLMIGEKWQLKKIFAYLLIGLSVFIGLFIPFWNHGNLISFIIERLGISLNQYPFTSINAFNFWGITGFWKPDNIYFQIGGYALVLFASVFLCFKLWARKNTAYYLLAFIFGASFIFFTRMHERHLLPIFAPLAIVAIENPLLLIPYAGLSLIYSANLFYSFRWITGDFVQVFPDFFLKLFSILNMGFVIFIFFTLSKKLKTTWQEFLKPVDRFLNAKSRSVSKVMLPKVRLSEKAARIILVSILAFAFLTRTFNLGRPQNEYFDEVYHAFTAKVILSSDAAKAWEWWNTPPEGFAYEWTHPPLAKLGMALGMIIFGENSFGYRIPGAILGTISVLLTYLIAKKLFGDEVTAILSAAALSLDGLALVMSRIGMNDSFMLFFTLLTVYFFLCQNNFLSALSFGLAISSKWSAIWVLPILFVIWLRRKNKLNPSLFFWFVLLPVAIYLLTYLQMFLTGHDFSVWWGMQEQMWWYHTGLKATHAYSSSWWSWPFLIRPIYLYTSSEVGGMVARIYAFGNPAVFWFGITSVIASFLYAFMEKNKNLSLVVFSYLIFFVPWALSPRIMFLYHYLPSIPFLAIATGYVLRRNPKLILAYLVICLLFFIYFYPHWAGLSVPLWLDRSFYWLPSWR